MFQFKPHAYFINYKLLIKIWSYTKFIDSKSLALHISLNKSVNKVQDFVFKILNIRLGYVGYCLVGLG